MACGHAAEELPAYPDSHPQDEGHAHRAFPDDITLQCPPLGYGPTLPLALPTSASGAALSPPNPQVTQLPTHQTSPESAAVTTYNMGCWPIGPPTVSQSTSGPFGL